MVPESDLKIGSRIPGFFFAHTVFTAKVTWSPLLSTSTYMIFDGFSLILYEFGVFWKISDDLSSIFQDADALQT